MKVVIDTHTLFWRLTSQNIKLTKKALHKIEESEEIILPTIVLLELLGLLEKKRQKQYFDILLDLIPNSKYIIVPLDLEIIKNIHKTKDKLELHDKVIVATAKLLDLPIITKDEQITKVYKKTIW